MVGEGFLLSLPSPRVLVCEMCFVNMRRVYRKGEEHVYKYRSGLNRISVGAGEGRDKREKQAANERREKKIVITRRKPGAQKKLGQLDAAHVHVKVRGSSVVMLILLPPFFGYETEAKRSMGHRYPQYMPHMHVYASAKFTFNRYRYRQKEFSLGRSMDFFSAKHLIGYMKLPLNRKGTVVSISSRWENGDRKYQGKNRFQNMNSAWESLQPK